MLQKRGPKWVAGKPAGEQALGNHGQYLQEQMRKGALQWAGRFLDDSGGLILYRVRDEAEVRAIAEHDPGAASMTGVPPLGFPKISNCVGGIFRPAFSASPL
ncbi:MAG TPA: YciI family protein [Bryobacteraceae bacterium]|nr:YciI family protein [Bryobacteraceae bacterium]